MFGSSFERKLIENNLYHYLSAAEALDDYSITVKPKAVYVTVTAPQPQYPKWELMESHLTFNRYINDHISVVSSCHFTCCLKSKVDETHVIKFHFHFNAQGKYISSMVSDPRQPNIREPKSLEPTPQDVERHLQSCQPILTLILQRKLEKIFDLRAQYEALEQALSRQHEMLQCFTGTDMTELQEHIHQANDLKKQAINILNALILYSETHSQRSYYYHVKKWINIINRQITSIEKQAHTHVIETKLEDQVLETELDDTPSSEDVLAIPSIKKNSGRLAVDSLEDRSAVEISADIDHFLQQLSNKEPHETWGDLRNMFDKLLLLELADLSSMHQRQLKKLKDVVSQECLLGNYQSMVPFFEKEYDSFVDTTPIFLSLIKQIVFYEKNPKKRKNQIKLAEFFYNHSELYKVLSANVNSIYFCPAYLEPLDIRMSVLLLLVINNNLDAFEMLLKQGVSVNAPHFIRDSYPFNALNGLMMINAYMTQFVKKMNISGFIEILFKHGATIASKPLDASKLISIAALTEILTDRGRLFNNDSISLRDDAEFREIKVTVLRNFKYLHYISNALHTAIYFRSQTKIELITNLLARSSMKEQLHALAVLLYVYEFDILFSPIGYGGLSLFLNQKQYNDYREEDRKSNALALAHICINCVVAEEAAVESRIRLEQPYFLLAQFRNELETKYSQLSYEEKKSIVVEQMLWCNDCSTKQLDQKYLTFHHFALLIAASYIQIKDKHDYALLVGLYMKFTENALPELPRDTEIQDVDVALIVERNTRYKELCVFASSLIEIMCEDARAYVQTRNDYKKMMRCLRRIQENEEQECISIPANQQESTSSMRP